MPKVSTSPNRRLIKITKEQINSLGECKKIYIKEQKLEKAPPDAVIFRWVLDFGLRAYFNEKRKYVPMDKLIGEPIQKRVAFNDRQIRDIERYRVKQGLKWESESIRQLLEIGLSVILK